MKAPSIKTPLPGPRARALVETDRTFVSPSYTRVYPLVVKEAQGMWVRDVDDNVFLDFTSGIAVCATGHCHPRVVQAIKDQADRLLHMSGTDFYYPPQIVLAEKLAALAPGDGVKRIYFGNSGAEAVEAAFKLARWHTRRELNIAFFGAFHGRTMGALSLTASKTIQKRHYIPWCRESPTYLTPIVIDALTTCAIPIAERTVLHWVEDTLFRTTMPPEEVAAIFVEPIQGEGGYIVPPPEFHRELYRVARKYGILYVADEVQSGMGRTGKMFAMEHFGVAPDIMALAKGIASGMPLGAMIARAEIMDWEAGSHASTFGGNPVSCQAALATIQLLEESLMANAAGPGRTTDGGTPGTCRRATSAWAMCGEKGSWSGVELVKDRETKERATAWRNRIVEKSL